MKKGLFCSLFLVTGLLWAASDLATTLQRLGLTPIAAVGPQDFTLASPSGKLNSLAEYKGKWIFLTFWATWCGPCRYELPTLEKLYQSLDKKNFVVLGISIDTGDSKAIAKFVQDNAITFPVLWDKEGKVANLYRASSIPVSYLISPDYKMVGSFQGAKTWSDYSADFAKLTELKKLPADFVAQVEKVVPVELEPPVIKIKFASDKLKVGQIYNLEVSISWTGNIHQYAIKTPTLTLPAEVEQGVVSAMSSSDVEGSLQRYIFPLKFKIPGKFTLGPAEMAFTSRQAAGSSEQFSRSLTVEVNVEKTGRWWVILVLVALAIALVCLFFYKKNRNKDSTKETAPLISEEQIDAVMRLKVSANPQDYQAMLLKLLLTGESDELERKKIIGLQERIGYGGQSLTVSELGYYEKRLNNFLNKSEE